MDEYPSTPVARTTAPRPPLTRRRRLLAGVASALLVFGLGTGTGVVAANAATTPNATSAGQNGTMSGPPSGTIGGTGSRTGTPPGGTTGTGTSTGTGAAAGT